MAKIFIADDNDNVRRSIKTALSGHEGWVVCGEASDGLEAVAKAQELDPDIIVLDLTMPGLDGLRATTEILKTMPGVPIVIYTLHESPQIRVEGKRVGAARVISKVKGIDTLIPAIEELLAQKATSAPPVSTAPDIAASVTEVAAAQPALQAESAETESAAGEIKEPPTV